MWTTFLNTVRCQLRRPSMLVWVFAFPVILSTIFVFMFSSLSTDGVPDAVRVAVVRDEAWDASTFSAVVDALSGASGEKAGTDAGADDALLEVHAAKDEKTAQKLLDRGDVLGIYAVDGQGEPSLTLAATAPSGLSQSVFEADCSILDSIASSYSQNAALIKTVAGEDPAALSDSGRIERTLGLGADVKQVRLTHGTPDEGVRYYYALLGMAALMAAQGAAVAVVELHPGESEVGARVCVSGTSRVRRFVGALAGSWVVSMLGLALAFAFMRLVAGVDFGGRDGLCVLGLATSSLLATGIGAAVGVLPLRGGIKARTGALTALSCLASLFAGLYGEGAMQLSDNLARAVPISVWVNPARLITDQFYSLYYYDSLAPFALRALVCVGAAAVLLLVASVATLRSGYEYR